MRKSLLFPTALPALLGLSLGVLALAGCGGGGGGGGSKSGTPTATPTTVPTTGPVVLQNLTPNLNQLYISSGDFAGGFIVAKGGAGINWYFTNLGLVRFIKVADRTKIRAYLDQFMKRVDTSTGIIADYSNISPPTTRVSDSDDAYISSFLHLASTYRRTTNDNVWWNANKDNLKKIGKKSLLDQQKSSGLIRARIDGVGPFGNFGYLMDNCENYAGLRDFAAELSKDGDGDASTYSTAASRVAQGIDGLYKGDHFEAADSGASQAFYPLRVAQVFPQLYDVPLGSAAQTKDKYDKGWTYLNALRSKGEDWTIGQNTDKSTERFPYMVIGAVAAKRGEKGLAQAQLNYYLGNLNSSSFPEISYIQDLGFATQLQDYLK